MVLPENLSQFVEEQPEYSPMQHACWDFLMDIGHGYYSRHAVQPAYGDSFRILPCRGIPRIEELDDSLGKQYGFSAVGVNGFIPPRAFMEFQRLGILPMSTDMRLPEHLAFTPSPDIRHEGFGHLVMISDPKYREILQRCGDLSARAETNEHDTPYYEAVRKVSALSEKGVSGIEMNDALRELRTRELALNQKASEYAQISRFFWYSVEFGLLEGLRIYGAGLLSSIQEGKDSRSTKVKKHVFDREIFDTPYYITEPQKNLYVARDFDQLLTILDEYDSEHKIGSRPITPINLEKSETRVGTEQEIDPELEALYLRLRSVDDPDSLLADFERFPTDWLGQTMLLPFVKDKKRVVENLERFIRSSDSATSQLIRDGIETYL